MNMMYAPKPQKQKLPFEDLAEGLVEVGETIKGLITPPQVKILNGVKIRRSKVSEINELLSLFYNQTNVYAIDVIKIYETIPDKLVSAVANLVKVISVPTYEDILKRFMEASRIVENPLITGIDALPKIDDFFGTQLIDCSAFNINRGSLAIIWSAMLLNLYSKYSSSVENFEKNRIIKGCISLALGVGVGFLQFCHKSPESPTNYIRLASEAYNEIRDKYNQHNENKIPDVLKIESPRKTLSCLTQNEKLSVGQALNMSYTFRIGDTFLTSLESLTHCGVLSKDIVFNMINTAWPIPTESEMEKMYKLYTENYIYFL